MPLKTAMPIDWRDAAPAPVEMTRGKAEREGEHDNGPEPQPRRLDRGVVNVSAGGPLLWLAAR